MHRSITLAFLMIALSLTACQESRDPQSADGALRLFGVALEQGDKALIKASLSQKTNSTLDAILKTLKLLHKEIDRFPSKEAKKWARQNALGEHLSNFKELNNADALWLALVGHKLKWAKDQSSGSVEQGLSPRRIISGGEQEGELIVLTRSDNKVSLRKEGVRWVVTSFEEPLNELHKTIKGSLKVLPLNRKEWVRRDRLDLDLPK